MKKTKTWQDCGSKWFGTLVVAISVAMCFRAYFYEAGSAATGCMQKTLWGHHTKANAEKTSWDVAPLSWLKWIWTGERIVEYKAPDSGVVRVQPHGNGLDGYADIFVGKSRWCCKLPMDASKAIAGRYVRKGETLWNGAVCMGDFFFVNRWIWNFRRPRNGEIMVFATDGIEGLQKHVHSNRIIKRMKARPGETYVIEHPLQEHPKTVTMGEDEYFACGDNFGNSFDSRYWGCVPGKNLLGVGSLAYWPFSRLRVLR